ncbi:MAG: hypothetical protein ACYC91_03185 [Solirubrobacteraceae bacterium]
MPGETEVDSQAVVRPSSPKSRRLSFAARARRWPLPRLAPPLACFAAVYIGTCLIGALLLLFRYEPFVKLFVYFSGERLPRLDGYQTRVDLALLLLAPLLFIGGFLAADKLVRARVRRPVAGGSAFSAGHSPSATTPPWLPRLLFSVCALWGAVALLHAGALDSLGSWFSFRSWITARTSAFHHLGFFSFTNIYMFMPLTAAWSLVTSPKRRTGRSAQIMRWILPALAVTGTLLLYQKRPAIIALVLIFSAWWFGRAGGVRRYRRKLLAAGTIVLLVYFVGVVLPIISSAPAHVGTNVGILGKAPAVVLYAALAPLTRTSGPALVYPAVYPHLHPYYGLDLGLDILGIGRSPNDNSVIWHVMNPNLSGLSAAPFQFPLYSQVGLIWTLVMCVILGLLFNLAWRAAGSSRWPRDVSAVLRSLMIILALYVATDSIRNSLVSSYGIAWAAIALLMVVGLLHLWPRLSAGARLQEDAIAGPPALAGSDLFWLKMGFRGHAMLDRGRRRGRSAARWLGAHPHWTVAALGAIAAVAMALDLESVLPTPWPLMPTRLTGIQDSLKTIHLGGPLLLGGYPAGPYDPSYFDDPGAYIFVPLLSKVFGIANPLLIIRSGFVALFALTAAIYPFVFYKLTRSLVAAVASPIVLFIVTRWLGYYGDIYWVVPWASLTILPLLLLLDRRWPRFSLVWLLGLMVLASWVHTMRSSSGYEFILPAIAIVIMRRWRWWRTAGAVALLIVAYLSVSTFVVNAIKADRNQRLAQLHVPPFAVRGSAGYWHTIYIGMGYLPNAWGIRYLDGIAAARVQHDAPGTVYLSAKYDTALEHAVTQLALAHPLAVLRQYLAKVVVVVADSWRYLLALVISLALVAMVAPDLRLKRRTVLLVLPALLLTFLQPIVAIPKLEYETNWFGPLGLVTILAATAMIQGAWTAARRSGGALAAGRSAGAAMHGFAGDLVFRSRTALLGRTANCSLVNVAGWWRPVRLSVLLLVVLCIVCAVASPIRHEANGWWQDPSGSLVVR